MASVHDAVLRTLKSHAHDLTGCLVYLDAGAAQAVAAGVGLSALQEVGVAAAVDLLAASPADLATAALLSCSSSPIRRVTYLITTLLAEAEAAVLAACHMHAAAAQFTVLCAVTQAAHADEQPAVYGSTCYSAVASTWQRQLNEQRQAAGQGPCSVEVRYCPLLLCPLGSNAFVLAPSCAAASLPRAGRLAAGYSAIAEAAAGEESDEEAGPAVRQTGAAGGGTTRAASRGGTSAVSGAAAASGLTLLAHSLAGIAAVLGHRPEAFALGPCSRLVCSSMAFVPAPAEDAPPAAVVLVDRLLDSVSPAQHADLLVQRMYDLLQQQNSSDSSSAHGGSGFPTVAAAAGQPPSSGSSRQAGVQFGWPALQLPMPCLDATAAGSGASDGGGGGDEGGSTARSMLPGSLRHPDDPQAERWLEFLLSRKGRDAPMFVRKWLREAARKENVPQGQRFKPGSISAAELRSLAQGLRRQGAAAAHRHSPLLQLAEVAAAALEGPHTEHWEAVQREERALLFACAESPGAAASHLVELCQLASSTGSVLRLADVLPLLVAAYCLLPDFLPWYAAGDGGTAGPFQPQQQAQLREALVDAVMACGSALAAVGKQDAGTADAVAGEAEAASTPSAAAESAAAAAGESVASEAAPQRALVQDVSPSWPLAGLCRRVALAAAKRAGPTPASSAAAAAATVGGKTEREESAHSTDGEELAALRLEVEDAVQAVLQRCRQLAALRASQLKQAKHLAATGQDGAPRHVPLLRQIAEAVLRDQALPDLTAGATTLSGLLRSGLGRFGLQAGPKPSDCSTVILFVVGGISLAELHEIMQAVEERAAQHAAATSGGGPAAAAGAAPQRVIVGATALLQPGEVCSHLFADLATA